MIQFVTAPDKSIIKCPIKLFLAGGITNCENWQSYIIERLFEDSDKFEFLHNVIVYNPRRVIFPIDIPEETEKQIVWEYNALKDADIISFWFSKETLNPIVLYELGKWGNSTNKTIVIGIDDGYERKRDVEIQTKLSRPDVKIAYTINEFYYKIILEIKKLNK